MASSTTHTSARGSGSKPPRPHAAQAGISSRHTVAVVCRTDTRQTIAMSADYWRTNDPEQTEAVSRFNRKARVELCRTVNARVWKVWAIYEEVDLFGIPSYTLIHIPTGRRVATCYGRYGHSVLTVLAARLDAIGDWSSSKREKLPLERGRAILAQWKDEWA